MIGIGFDIVEMQHMADILQRSGDVFLQRVYSDAEIQSAERSPNRIGFYGGNFAAKEALFKALMLNWTMDIDLRHIETLRGSHGVPMMKLSGIVAKIAEQKGVQNIHVSISSAMSMVIAIVLVE